MSSGSGTAIQKMPITKDNVPIAISKVVPIYRAREQCALAAVDAGQASYCVALCRAFSEHSERCM